LSFNKETFLDTFRDPGYHSLITSNDETYSDILNINLNILHISNQNNLSLLISLHKKARNLSPRCHSKFIMTTFKSPQWIPKMDPVPDHIPISELMLNEKYGRYSLDKSRPPFVCGLTGDSYTWREVSQRTEYLARALKQELNLKSIHEGSKEDGFNQMEKVVGIFSVNCVSTRDMFQPWYLKQYHTT